MLNHVRSWLYVGYVLRSFATLDGLPGLYGLKYDGATACGLPLYLCSYKLDGFVTRTKAKLKNVSALESEDNHTRRSLTPVFEAVADKTLREFSAPTTINLRTGPVINIGDNAF